MNYKDTIFFTRLKVISAVLFIWLISGIFNVVKGQEKPPRPAIVTVTTQNLSFGAFTPGVGGGTVTISSAGSRSATGDVILLNLGYSFSTALYEVTANPGTVVSLVNGPDVILTGSGGGSMTLHIGASSPVSPFVITTIPPAFTLLNVGGTLTVGNILANPPGDYSGMFDITFIQE
jgi:hypothetical protein